VPRLNAGRIVIAGINYWPEPTGIGPYTTELAEYLAARAQSVEVLTGLPSYPEWTVPPAYRRGMRFHERRGGVAITRVKHYVPSTQDVARRGLYELSFVANALAAPTTTRPNLVIGVSPALGGAVAAAALAARTKARLVVIVQDLVGAAADQSGIGGGRGVAGTVSRMEGAVLRRACAVVVVSDAFRARLDHYGVISSKVHVVPNWSRVGRPPGDRAAMRARLGWGPDVTIALHAGNMGLKQGLENVIAAARLTQADPNLRWVLMGEGSQRSQLWRAAAGMPNLQFLPLCQAADYPAVLDAADILLLNERGSVHEMSLPSKLTSYFASGRPVAAAVRSDGAAATELARAGAPAPVPPGEPAQLVRLVRELAAIADRSAAYGRQARAYADRNLGHEQAMLRMEAVLCGRATVAI
jgi:glycosyltransferase involved in cell wall biosynthesis